MKNPLLSRRVPSSAQGYSAFATDNFANFTSVCGYLLPVYWDYLEPGDKVNIKTLLRTRTQPLAKPAMATVIERIEWFAVPIQQLYKPFSTKFYGVNDVESDLLPINGYDDYLPFMNMDDINVYFKSLPTSLGTQSVIPTLIPTFGEARRLSDALGLPNMLGNADTTASTLSTSVCVLPFAAYHKIYFDHYRLTDREENDPSYYNFDSFYGGLGATSQVTNINNRFDKIFTLHKRPYMRDYFTSMQISPLFGSADVNAAGNDLGAINNWLNGLTSIATGIPDTSSPNLGALQSASVNPTSVRLPASSSAQVTFARLGGTFNPANIRSLFAVEKLLEVTRRAKKHYDMQTLAHFGVSVPKGIAGECFKLGTHEQYLKIGDVIGTANVVDSTDDPISAIGQLGGTGSSGAESKIIKFEADCHCVLMAIYSAEPVVNVQNEGTPRIFTSCRASEFYKSEFDNLGLQPVFRRELYTDNASDGSNNNSVVGWNYRYYQNKMKYNRSFGGCTTSSFKEWSLNRQSIGSGSALSRNFFYVWPTDLNDILLVKYLGVESSSNLYFQDYFINQIYFDVVKSSKKSLYGDVKY